MEKKEYSLVTELTGYNVTAEQMQRMYARYRFAREFCKGKEVLEIACGSGQGLGYLAVDAKRVVGGDYDETIVRLADDYYRGRLEIRQMDAHDLPFDSESFDVVILYEAIYYLSQPEKFFSEAHRVLKRGGVLIVCSANKDWSGFNPSLYSYSYFSAPELYRALVERGFKVNLFAHCPAGSNTRKEKVISTIKQIAKALHLMPETMKGKEKLKRFFFGKLVPLPPEITDGIADYTPPVPVPHDAPVRDYKVIYTVAYVQ